MYCNLLTKTIRNELTKYKAQLWNKYFLVLLTVYFSICSQTYGQNQSITINSTVTSNSTIYTFSPTEIIYSLVIDGVSTLNSDSSSIRVILIDNYNNEYLIYESYSMIHSFNPFTFSSYGEETKYLNGIDAVSVKVEIKDASLTINNIYKNNNPINGIASLQTQHKASILQNKINAINQSLTQKGAIWIAGITSLSQYSYQEKKNNLPFLFNPVWQGYEYYSGGVFDASVGMFYEPDPNIVEEFDWRNRHNINWNTTVKNQGSTQFCVSFGTCSTLETLINLYYKNLSYRHC